MNLEHLKQRKQFSINSYIISLRKFIGDKNYNKTLVDLLIINSPTSQGVVLNGGNKGSEYGPQVILNNLKKMTVSQKQLSKQNFKIYINNILSHKINSLDQNQKLSISQLDNILKNTISNNSKLIHLGGGHDHIYPMIMSLSKKFPKHIIHVINIDAHLDTRMDTIYHSGTPFRQLINNLKNKIKISQIGIHPFCNQSSNFSEIDNYCNIYKNANDFLANINNTTNFNNEIIVLSLDSDGLDASFMSAVSAPNHYGMSKQEMDKILTWYLSYLVSQKHQPGVFGIYEYNPVFDHILTPSAKYLASIIYKFIN